MEDVGEGGERKLQLKRDGEVACLGECVYVCLYVGIAYARTRGQSGLLYAWEE